MKEVVKKEIIKWLDAEIIYPIFDSAWVSPIECVPNKECMTVISNEKNELISTRTFTGWRIHMDYMKLNKNCLDNLDIVLTRCEKTNLMLNWEKCHFMVKEGIVLGHKISKYGLEVDQAKIEVIEKLPPHVNIKGIRSFLGHVGFYRRFIKDFSKITKPLCQLLQHDVPFVFSKNCLNYFNVLKKAVVSSPVVKAPDWIKPFELMCDESDFEISVVLAFDLEIRDKKGVENLVADNLSRLPEEVHDKEAGDIHENFPNEKLLIIIDGLTPWYADIVNYLVSGVVPPEFNSQQRKRFFHMTQIYFVG
ncbi:uncharacterized protein LOC131624649 [Vicia villosa]|uniref:uncharacterized protein LOC131624649 n=1 Tax=Vicia villosa TaxID=3911 RepID=UPI00273CE74F|nr:uncharacterized protein LOC131624649 [Vicia villosa]